MLAERRDGGVGAVWQWIEGHEKLCEKRDKDLSARLSTMERIGLTIAGTGLLGFATLLYDILIAHSVHFGG